MKISRATIVTIVVLVVLTAGGVWTLNYLAWKEVTTRTGYGPEALRNPLLAAERLINKMGGKAQSVTRLEGLPPTDGTLIVNTYRRLFTESFSQSLLAWVEQGGRLVVYAPWMYTDQRAPRDHLLDALRVRKYGADAKDVKRIRRADAMGGFGKGASSRKPDDCPEIEEDGDEMRLADSQRDSLKVCFEGWTVLSTDAETSWRALLKDKVQALALQRGKGEVIVFADTDFMENFSIGDADHADFLLSAIRFEPGQTVWLVASDEVAGLWDRVMKHGWTALVALVLAIALWLWRSSLTAGPLAPPATVARRSIREHVIAAGEYLWRSGNAHTMWTSTLAAAERTIRRRLPQTLHEEGPDRLQSIAKASGLTIADVNDAMSVTRRPAAGTFARAISILEHIRKTL